MPPPSALLPQQSPPAMWWHPLVEHNPDVSTEALRDAQQQAAHLRALHAAVVNSSNPLRSPTKSRPRRYPSPTPATRATQLEKDYPVFTPSYEEFKLGGKKAPPREKLNSVERREPRETNYVHGLDRTIASGLCMEGSSCSQGTDEYAGSSQTPNEMVTKGSAKATSDNTASVRSAPHHKASVHPSKGPPAQHAKELKFPDSVWKKPLGEFFTEPKRKKQVNSETSPSCDMCKPLPIGRENTTVVPLMDSNDFTILPSKERAGNNNPFKSWFFRGKKKFMNVPPPTKVSKEVLSNIDSDAISNEDVFMNSTEFKVFQANKKRDAAVVELLELKIAMGEMGKKLEQLELYCENLKHALDKQNFRNVLEYMDMSNSNDLDYSRQDEERAARISCVSPSSGTTPSKNEFFHAVTEARVGVKQFCRILVQQIEDSDVLATEKISSILRAYNVRVAPKVSKTVRYHLEALINQGFYENFENVGFEKNGSHCILDPKVRCHAFHQTYLRLSKLCWSEILRRDSGSYSERFDRFCDQKMSLINSIIVWEDRWCDELAQAFFVAARSIWLVHLLAFSMDPSAAIFRVGKEATFDPRYMDEMPLERTAKNLHSSSSIRIMVMPGFFVLEEIVKCKVLCRKG
eukprot:c23044_g1_i1 orf=135-2030(+)